ncbi:hypothetical protein KO566_13785 [Flavobacteriaceae bacterium XHP0103]|uniref:DUF6660 family protein n=1 Tax=Marixanthotalea marina TaxID=2844359 RepID=UPI00298A057B|nr:DUF6660 family protein [Marixanthotalea marina]MBU3823129.1 hypothetical protein [Marixanthotalea marina]
MKFLAFILSIYIFTLNLVPCEDTGTFDNEVKTEISQDLGDNHQHQDADLCSPFCICQCCHIHVTHFNVVDYSLSNTVIPTQLFYYFDGLEKDFNTTLLQPPQV